MENVLGSLDGVVDADASYVKGLATVTYDPARVTPGQMVEAVNTRTFFHASLPDPAKTATESTNQLNLLPFIVGGALLLAASSGIWLVVARRRAGQASSAQTSS